MPCYTKPTPTVDLLPYVRPTDDLRALANRLASLRTAYAWQRHRAEERAAKLEALLAAAADALESAANDADFPLRLDACKALVAGLAAMVQGDEQ